MACVGLTFAATLTLITLPCLCFEAISQAPSPKQLTAGQEAIAGATAGFAARIAVAPIDLVKIRLQLQRNHVGDFAQGLAGSKSLPKYTGMWQTMRTVAAEEGCFALWKGNVPAQLMVRFDFQRSGSVPCCKFNAFQVMAFVAIKFSTYNQAKNWIHKKYSERSNSEALQVLQMILTR